MIAHFLKFYLIHHHFQKHKNFQSFLLLDLKHQKLYHLIQKYFLFLHNLIQYNFRFFHSAIPQSHCQYHLIVNFHFFHLNLNYIDYQLLI